MNVAREVAQVGLRVERVALRARVDGSRDRASPARRAGVVREADSRENTPQAFALARKPDADADAAAAAAVNKILELLGAR